MKRRNFLKSSAIGLPLLMNGFKLSTISRSALSSAVNNTDKVLILIQLNGGNDGLNTLIPIDQYSKLVGLRSNILIPETDILNIEDKNGFHPSFEGMKNIYNDGKLNIVQDVGYPNQNRSHFRSLDIWNTGSSSSDELTSTGWYGRYIEDLHPDYPEGYPNGDCPDPFAISLGYTVSETCQGTALNFSTALIDPDTLSTILESEEGFIDPNTCYGSELQFVRQSVKQTNAYTDTISSASDLGNNLIDYPDTDLAQQLKIIARLVSGGLQTSIYTVYLGGFDTHANQVAGNGSQSGSHGYLLQTLSDAIAAFQTDIEMLGVDNRVVGMTYSEFGRQIKSNNSLGTDHGTAAPLFVFGACANGGIIGENYEIPADVPNQAGVPMQYDFRSVYGSILMDWFGVEEAQVKDLLFEDFQHIPIINENCTVSVDNPIIVNTIQSYNYPNPFEHWTTIHFNSLGENIKISVFDTLGHEIKVVTSQHFPSGEHKIQVDLSAFPAGIYHYRIVSKYAQQTKNLHKIR